MPTEFRIKVTMDVTAHDDAVDPDVFHDEFREYLEGIEVEAEESFVLETIREIEITVLED